MNIRHWLGIGALTAVVAACGGGGGIGGTGGTLGTLRMSITDAPSCGYDEVNVTIEKVRVHQSASAGEADAGWSEIVLNPAKRVDLLSLSNGVLEELGETQLPAGTYTQVRLVLASNGAGAPFANSVVLSDTGTEVALDTPSGQQSGLKLNANIDVPADKIADVVLDFDACKSVVKRGNSGRYNLKPVIAVIPVLSDAGMRIVGWISPAIAASAPSVSVQASGVPVKSTVPDAVTGRFVLYPVPAGTYDLVIGANGRVTSVMTGVPVVTTAYTYVNAQTLPIAPAAAASAPRAVTGVVAPAAAASAATVRALQSFTTGPTVEVAFAPVDADTGAFAFSLPVDAPQKTTFVGTPGTQPPAPVTFTADAPRAGLYTLEAASAGITKVQAIDAKAAVPPVTFTFP
ncbi:MAG: DUF4382 domain-containing protein [Burkholderiaceae bacterium]